MSTWTKPQIPTDATLVTSYVYTVEQGTPVYKKERWEWQASGQRKKGFKLRAFLGYASGKRDRPQWDVKLEKDVRRVPYHLPPLRAAIAAGQPIYIVDGEKDVETLEQHGHVATTGPLGTMAYWRGEHAAYFYGATHVTIIADKDADGTGRRDAFRVADSLKLLGIVAKVVEVPVGKDVTEFAEAAV